MNHFEITDEEIRRHLLADLEETRRELIEERCFTDKEFSDRVENVESQLIEEFLRRTLFGQELILFKENFGASDHQRRKVGFMASLLKATTELAKPKKRPLAVLAGYWEAAEAFFRAHVLVLAATVALIVLGGLILRAMNSNTQLEYSQASQTKQKTVTSTSQSQPTASQIANQNDLSPSPNAGNNQNDNASSGESGRMQGSPSKTTLADGKLAKSASPSSGRATARPSELARSKRPLAPRISREPSTGYLAESRSDGGGPRVSKPQRPRRVLIPVQDTWESRRVFDPIFESRRRQEQEQRQLEQQRVSEGKTLSAQREAPLTSSAPLPKSSVPGESKVTIQPQPTASAPPLGGSDSSTVEATLLPETQRAIPGLMLGVSRLSYRQSLTIDSDKKDVRLRLQLNANARRYSDYQYLIEESASRQVIHAGTSLKREDDTVVTITLPASGFRSASYHLILKGHTTATASDYEEVGRYSFSVVRK